MSQLEGRVAIVTGAGDADGMGFASCKKLAAAGVTVVLTDLLIDDDGSNALNARAVDIVELGGVAHAFAVDVTDRLQIDACVKDTLGRYGRIDILFNNAGTPVGAGDFLTMNDRQWDLSYQINLKGVADFCQSVLPSMIQAGGGVIINNASVAGLGAIPGLAAYVATKFAVVGLTKALATEFGPHGVRVNAVCPGMVDTRMGQHEIELMRQDGETFEEAKQRLAAFDVVPMGRWAQPSEVADAVAYLASDNASYISGVALPVAGGMAPGL